VQHHGLYYTDSDPIGAVACMRHKASTLLLTASDGQIRSDRMLECHFGQPNWHMKNKQVISIVIYCGTDSIQIWIRHACDSPKHAIRDEHAPRRPCRKTLKAPGADAFMHYSSVRCSRRNGKSAKRMRPAAASDAAESSCAVTGVAAVSDVTRT
jgi:hypothetical protein